MPRLALVTPRDPPPSLRCARVAVAAAHFPSHRGANTAPPTRLPGPRATPPAASPPKPMSAEETGRRGRRRIPLSSLHPVPWGDHGAPSGGGSVRAQSRRRIHFPAPGTRHRTQSWRTGSRFTPLPQASPSADQRVWPAPHAWQRDEEDIDVMLRQSREAEAVFERRARDLERRKAAFDETRARSHRSRVGLEEHAFTREMERMRARRDEYQRQLDLLEDLVRNASHPALASRDPGAAARALQQVRPHPRHTFTPTAPSRHRTLPRPCARPRARPSRPPAPDRAPRRGSEAGRRRGRAACLAA